MKKALKWIGILLGGLVGLITLAVVILSNSADARLKKEYAIQPAAVVIPTDNASVDEGKRLASIYCASCHGEDLGGTEFFHDPALAIVDAPNLTSGRGGVGSYYSDVDWVRSIRHGVDPQGRALFIMPSKDFYHFSDEHLGQIIAYLKSVPPVDHETNGFSTTLLGRVLLAVGAFGDVLNAESIDHDNLAEVAPLPAASAEYGDYLVKTFGCRTCHGSELAGGKDPNPDAPPGPNLTPGGNLVNWSEQVFITMVRTRQSEWMPFESLNKMSDYELKAIWLYLESLPPLATKTK